MRATRYALIPTHNRPTELARLVSQLDGQADFIVIIDNASDPSVSEVELRASVEHANVIVLRDEKQPPNLYNLWNLGFDAISTHHDVNSRQVDLGQWDVAVFNDDTSIPDGWYDYVAAPLAHRATAVAVSCTDPYGILTSPLLKSQSGDGNINVRMCPWAFVVRGELNLRADESFGWWWGDTDFDWHACRNGGVLLLPGYTTQNTLANSTTVGALAHQAALDGQTFTAKWGFRPW